MTTRRGLAIGCGGTLGFAWTIAALSALQEKLEWDVRDAEVLLGTSAGAEIAAALGAGVTPQQLLDAVSGAAGAESFLARHAATIPGKVPPLPRPGLPAPGLLRAGVRRRSVYTAVAGLLPRGRGDATWLRDYGDALATGDGWTQHLGTWLVAADAVTGERVAFGSPGAPKVGLGTAVAASWAIPGWFPPVAIGGRRYVDGGAVSSVSADLLVGLGLDEVIVLAPMTSETAVPGRGASRVERLLRRQMTHGLDGEIGALRASGTRVVRIEPGPDDLAVMGANFMDASRRAATLAFAAGSAPIRVAAALSAAPVPTDSAQGPRR